MLETSTGGGTPVRPLKKSAVHRRKGVIARFTPSATALPDTSKLSLGDRYRTLLDHVDAERNRGEGEGGFP